MHAKEAEIGTGALTGHNQLLFGLGGGGFFDDGFDLVKIRFASQTATTDGVPAPATKKSWPSCLLIWARVSTLVPAVTPASSSAVSVRATTLPWLTSSWLTAPLPRFRPQKPPLNKHG